MHSTQVLQFYPVGHEPNVASAGFASGLLHLVTTRLGAALTGRGADAGGDADAVVNDGEHVDVVLHAGLQAGDSAAGGISWNPYL